MRNATRGGAVSDMPALPRLTSFPRGRECRHTRGTQATADPLEGRRMPATHTSAACRWMNDSTTELHRVVWRASARKQARDPLEVDPSHLRGEDASGPLLRSSKSTVSGDRTAPRFSTGCAPGSDARRKRACRDPARLMLATACIFAGRRRGGSGEQVEPPFRV